MENSIKKSCLVYPARTPPKIDKANIEKRVKAIQKECDQKGYKEIYWKTLKGNPCCEYCLSIEAKNPHSSVLEIGTLPGLTECGNKCTCTLLAK